MIDKKDLRIGNSVMNSGRLFTVDSLTPLNAIIKENGNYRVVAYENLDPIPITEEALVKMGAIVTKKNNYNLNGMAITNFNGKFIEYVHQIELKGIHHLQNVYYFTRQTELTYEP